jgi:pheromone shutdown-related protein TraB
MTDVDQDKEPLIELTLAHARVSLLGTAHVSRASAEVVRRLCEQSDYDAVAVELCPSRYHAILDPDSLARMDLFKVLREGKGPMVAASLALGAYQQRLAEEFGIEPGAEMRAAIDAAKAASVPVLLIDREVGVTLKRIYHNVPWWRRFGLVAGLLASVISREKISEEDIEQLKQGDLLETTFSQFADQSRELYQPLIDERDQYMAIRLREEIMTSGYRRVLAVVGAGHLAGIARYLSAMNQVTAGSLDARLAQLEVLPPPARWYRLFPWLIVAVILIGFTLGFQRSTELGWQLVADWVLINGGLSALGALLAGGHVFTVVGAFVAAPLTSLNPTIGAGMVTAAIEIYFRKPRVGDFSQLRTATAHLKGWWQNRVARTLLVFLLSTLGSAAGTYLAGFRILERLAGS